MIVRHIDDVKGTHAQVDAKNWTSVRFLLAKDGMGFSMHETIIKPDTETQMWYKHHLEAVYCVEGNGEIEDLATGKVHPIQTGTLYALDQHDRHKLRAGHNGLRLVCVFNPPVTGAETHDESGAYPPPTAEHPS